MAVKSYVGVANVAEEVTKAYIGVNNVARKVNKIYAGVNGVAKLVYSSNPPLEIVTWAGGTDAQIVAMVEAADAGLINLSDYWHVGDTRTVNLSAMSATGVGESHAAQNVELVLMNAGGKTLYNAVASGRNTCSFIVGLKNCLSEGGYMNSTDTNAGGWFSSARRMWCNSVFKDSIPNTLLPIFKIFYNKASDGNQSTHITTDADFFALPAEVEVFGYVSNSVSGEGQQFTWYNTPSNRIKSGAYWWERSPVGSINNGFCIVNGDGTPGANLSSGSGALAPFGCI